VTSPRLQTSTLSPAAGERIVVDRLRGTAPAYVFLHGLGSVRDGEKSRALLRHAHARGRAAARFDFRGHGESSGRIGAVTFTELLADAGAVLDAVGPAVLVGSSLGGLVAAHLAAARPRDVRAVALLSPAFGFLPHMRDLLDDQGRLHTGEGVAFAIEERALADAARHDEQALPRRLSMPVFLAHGSDDDVVPPALSAAFAAAVPHQAVDLWIVPGGDHRLSRDIAAILDRMEALLQRGGVP